MESCWRYCNGPLHLIHHLSICTLSSVSKSETLLILNTCPDREHAERIAGMLVSEKLAACVNLIDNIASIYRWQGGIERDSETLLLIKSKQEHYLSIEAAIQQHHPYEIPEVIALPIENGSSSYLEWIAQSTINKK